MLPCTAVMAVLSGAFVLGDVVNLREEAAESAPIIAKLRIGTEVVIEQTQGDWVRIHSVSPAGAAGFTLARLVGSDPPTGDALRRELVAATTADARLSLLQRLVALEGFRHENYANLARALRAAKRLSLARAADALARGAGPTHLLVCDPVGGSSQLLLAATWQRGRGWTSWTSLPFEPTPEGAEHPPPSAELVRMRLELAGLAWARSERDGFVPLPGTPFPAPEATLVYNGLALELQAVHFGQCEADVVVSAPLVVARPTKRERGVLEAKLTEKRADYELETRALLRASRGAPLIAVVRFNDQKPPDPNREDGKIVEDENGFWFLAIHPDGKVEELWSVTDTGGGC